MDPHGTYSEIHLGNDPESGEVFQAVVPAGCWFGASVTEVCSWSFVGCTVSPGFDFNDFEMANQETLLKQFPDLKEVIDQLT